MSESDSYKSPEVDNQSDYSEFDETQFINERIDRHSDETSSYNHSEKADPKSINKKYVRRYNPRIKKMVRVEFFPTNPTPNSFIKHAMSGSVQYVDGKTLRSGTKDEDLFFSVILATGEIKTGAPVLFYDNPEQYERHFFAKVPQNIKDKWIKKRNAALHSFTTKMQV